MKRVAIIGSGISGMGAAWALRNTANVTVFEAADRAGGHAHTHQFEYDNHPTSVDLGFIVYNADNYPNLIGLFDALDVDTQPSDMSFSVSDPGGWEWASTVRGIFAQRINLLSPRFHRFWRTILKFNDIAREELAAGKIHDPTLKLWLDRHGFDADFRDNYILPMGAAIWSTPENRILDYPARSFFQFFDNHRLMHKERPKWRTVAGGSQQYVEKIAAALGGALRCGVGVERVFPFFDRIAVRTTSGHTDIFDHVIFATHADQTLELVRDSYEEASFLLQSVKYRPNTIYLHRDQKLMPAKRNAWASWNVLKQASGDICLTYWMNRLQDLPDERPLFITLNPDVPPDEELTFLKYDLDHPQFDAASEAAVRALKRLQGQNGLWFAGAWMGRGFHEDGLKSGLSAALSLGGKVPWTPVGVDIVRPSRKTVPVEMVQGATI